MKCRLFCLMLLFAYNLQAQHFTRGQVYDFQVGDMIQTEYAIGTSAQAAPVEYRIDSIMQVHYRTEDSMAFDTKITRFYKITQSGGYSIPETTILTIRINKLTDTLFHDFPWCKPYQDTIYEDETFCDVLVSERKAISDNPYCRFTSRVIPGLGGPYSEQSSQDTTTNLYYFQSFRLVYAYKNGKHCGDLIAASSTVQDKNDVLAFPSPFVNHLHFSGIAEGTSLQITDLTGRVTWTGIWEGKPLDTSTWSPGPYFIVLTNGRGSHRVITAVKSP